MTPKEGYILAKKKYPDREPVKCTDFGDSFVYATVRIPKTDTMVLSTKSMDSAIYVNKENGVVMIFNPLIQKIDKTKAKEIKVFKWRTKL